MPSLFIKNPYYCCGYSLVEIHISDIHFGVINPKKQYDILVDQFLKKISKIQFDIISIDGDLFDCKTMANSDTVMYASMFIHDIIMIARNINASVILISGTESHDDKQLKMFYKYQHDDSVDIHIVEQTQFIHTKGAKILCIPEEYNKGFNYYSKFLYESGSYDAAFIHGIIKGSIMGFNKMDLDARTPVFSIENFANCSGPIICGHVHTAGCYNKYIYYNGSPIRWQYGEEQKKGFIILLHNLASRRHYVHFEEITSFRYDTINIDSMIDHDPKEIISYVKKLQNQGIDHIRLEILKYSDNIAILKSHYRNNPYVKIESNCQPEFIYSRKEIEQDNDKLNNYQYVLNEDSAFNTLARFINDNKGFCYITGDEIMELSSES